jgi:hypothetical protein
MALERRTRVLLLAALAVVLAIVTYFIWPRPSATASPASNGKRASAADPRPTPPQEAPAVHLPALGEPRPKLVEAERNLFRFKPKPTPPPPPAPTTLVSPPAPVPTGPPTPPPPPRITLKFIGTLDRKGEKWAILSDATGRTDYAKEGQEIQGRYRILKIGVESIDIAYLDGTGRQTIRLTGS